MSPQLIPSPQTISLRKPRTLRVTRPPGSTYSLAVDAQTVLLLHGDGADASVVVTDSSPGAKVMTVNGNAQIDTAQSRFGGASMLFDGTGDYITTPDHADFAFGTGDFTIDFWVCFNSVVGAHSPLTKQVAGFGPFLFSQAAAVLQFFASSDGASWNIAASKNISASLVAGVWQHVAVVRSGQNFATYLNGVQADTWTSALALVVNTQLLTIGSAPAGGAAFDGWMDELRISKGVARWTANFTPPAAPYG